jgi:hypothetical protein
LSLNEAFRGDSPNRVVGGVPGGNSRQRNLLPLAGSSFSSFEVFEDCSGGNSRLSYLLWCGGRSFFDHEISEQNNQATTGKIENRAAGLNHRWDSLTSLLRIGGEAIASFGVFFRFQVTDFDFFHFFLYHFIAPFYFGLFVVVVWKNLL